MHAFSSNCCCAPPHRVSGMSLVDDAGQNLFPLIGAFGLKTAASRARPAPPTTARPCVKRPSRPLMHNTRKQPLTARDVVCVPWLPPPRPTHSTRRQPFPLESHDSRVGGSQTSPGRKRKALRTASAFTVSLPAVESTVSTLSRVVASLALDGQAPASSGQSALGVTTPRGTITPSAIASLPSPGPSELPYFVSVSPPARQLPTAHTSCLLTPACHPPPPRTGLRCSSSTIVVGSPDVFSPLVSNAGGCCLRGARAGRQGGTNLFSTSVGLTVGG